METRAPTVVAVVVTSDPDDTLEVTLGSLAEQDYAELSTLVLVNRGPAQIPARVASVMPDAFVAVLEEDRGFGAAVNEALGKVEGAAFLLLCVPLVARFVRGSRAAVVASAVLVLALVTIQSVVVWNTVLATTCGIVAGSFCAGLGTVVMVRAVAGRPRRLAEVAA